GSTILETDGLSSSPLNAGDSLPTAEPDSGRVVGSGTRAAIPAPANRRATARHGPVRVRRHAASHLFSDGLHRLSSIRARGWRVGGNPGGRKRRCHWRGAFHGR